MRHPSTPEALPLNNSLAPCSSRCMCFWNFAHGRTNFCELFLPHAFSSLIADICRPGHHLRAASPNVRCDCAGTVLTSRALRPTQSSSPGLRMTVQEHQMCVSSKCSVKRSRIAAFAASRCLPPSLFLVQACLAHSRAVDHGISKFSGGASECSSRENRSQKAVGSRRSCHSATWCQVKVAPAEDHTARSAGGSCNTDSGYPTGALQQTQSVGAATSAKPDCCVGYRGERP